MSEAKARELLQNALDHIVTLRETIETIHKLYPKLTVAICGATFDEEAARAYLAAVPAPPAEPRVPREPTPRMCEAACRLAEMELGLEAWVDQARDLWIAMYDAAPAAKPVAQPRSLLRDPIKVEGPFTDEQIRRGAEVLRLLRTLKEPPTRGRPVAPVDTMNARDSARYRWLREHVDETEERFDAAVDDAMLASRKDGM